MAVITKEVRAYRQTIIMLTVVHALEKRKKVTGDLAIPDHILADADL